MSNVIIQPVVYNVNVSAGTGGVTVEVVESAPVNIEVVDVISSGSGTGTRYEFTQAVASTTWNIIHNLGQYYNVSLLDDTNQEVVGSINHNSVNQTTVTFSTPVSGKAIFS